VKNTGGTTLTNVLVTDNILGAIGGPISLNAGANQTFTKAQVLTANTTNIGTATATSPTGTVTFNATATVTVVSVTAPTLTLSLNTTMDGTSTPIVTNITSAVLLDKSGAPVKTATIPDSITAKFSLSGLTPGDYFIEINGLTGDRLPTRIDSTASDINQQVGLRLRNSIIGELSNPTYRIKVYPSGLNSHPVVNYNTGFNESIYNFVIVPGNTSKIEVRVLNSSEELSNFSTASLNHPFPTVSFQNWILDFPGASTNHGRVYNNTDSNCNGCHGNLDTKVTPYSSITTGNGWCFRCHYGKTGPRNGFVDPRVSVVAAISLTKTPSATQVTSGTSVTYTYVVKNTGGTTLTNVLVTDNILGAIGGPISLNAGANQTFTKAQVLIANTTNIGTATATSPTGTVTFNATATVIVTPPAASSISLTKTPSATQVTSGTSVTYTYVVKNTGGTTLTNVLVTDNVLGAIGGPITLNAGANQTFTKAQVITANTTNIGTARGTDPSGMVVTFNVSATVSVIVQPPPSTVGSISGFKINADTGKGIPGWTITLIDTNSGVKKVMTTSADGSYMFGNLPAGSYLVKEQLRNDFKHVTKPVIHIDLSKGEKSVNNNFVNRPKKKGEKSDTE
jgi:hypothetical protein